MTKSDIKTYYRYFRYVLKHKKNVFLECLKTGNILHGITHDLSKFLPSEFFNYADKFYGGDYAYKYFEVIYNFEFSWLLHQHRNKHHWDYWVKSSGYPVEMPKKYIKQMIADWNAVGIIKGDTAKKFYNKNKDKMKLHIETTRCIEKILK